MAHIIGREAEWSVIEAFLGRSTEGPRALVVEGAAGIGKSTLWLAAVAAARNHGYVVLSSRPAEGERLMANVVLGDLLRDVRPEELATLPTPRRRAFESALPATVGQRPEPASCPPAASRPSPSCPASRSRPRRVGSTTLMSPASTTCSRTRPPTRPSFVDSGDVAQGILMGPHGSPYFVCEAWENNRGATAAEMVTAMVANEALATSGLGDVAIGGLTGKQFDVRLDPDWTETCPGDPPTLDLGDMRTRGFLLDTPDRGVIVIFVGSLHSAGHEAFLTEAMPIIESFQFDLNP